MPKVPSYVLNPKHDTLHLPSGIGGLSQKYRLCPFSLRLLLIDIWRRLGDCARREMQMRRLRTLLSKSHRHNSPPFKSRSNLAWVVFLSAFVSCKSPPQRVYAWCAALSQHSTSSLATLSHYFSTLESLFLSVCMYCNPDQFH